jgi:hypothetical protein
MKLNLAQAYKWQGSHEKSKELMSTEDWSSRGNHICLGVALRHDNYDDAVTLMRRIGKSDEVKEHDYKDWPIFREFRKQPDFLTTYEEIFGKPFAPTEKIVTKFSKSWNELKVDYVYENSLATIGIEETDFSI